MSFFTARHRPAPRSTSAGMSLSLQPTPAGCTLRDDRERTIFRAEGRDARRQCLVHASDLGALYLRFEEAPVIDADSLAVLPARTQARGSSWGPARGLCA